MTPDEIAREALAALDPAAAIASYIREERAAREKAEAELEATRNALANTSGMWLAAAERAEKAEAERDEALRRNDNARQMYLDAVRWNKQAREAALREAADHFLRRHNNNWDKHNIAWAILALINKPQEGE